MPVARLVLGTSMQKCGRNSFRVYHGVWPSVTESIVVFD